ncbi:phage tail tip lysozyme [Enterococcus sp. AN402]|uniref:phage tail tip lysozyme n=1 Tax=Enterococcus sp. AN402 TaxID=3151386 RepID=UPI003458E948
MVSKIMKTDEFVKTAQEKHQAGESLVLTEQTDAINSGIVGETSPHSPKGYSPSARNPKIQSFVDGETFHDEKITPQRNKGLRTAIQRSGQVGIHKGINKALEDTELEGVDDTYYKGKRTYQTAKQSKKYIGRLKRKTLLSEKKEVAQESSHVVQTSKTSLAKAKSKENLSDRKKFTFQAKNKAQAQAKGYFKKNVYQTVAKKCTTISVSKSIALPAGKAVIGKLIAFASPVLFFIFLGLLSLFILSALFAGSSNEENHSFGSLSGVQLEVAQVLRKQGLDNIQIAAIMGNISGESGWNTTAEYHGEGNNTSYEYGYGLFQFTDTIPGIGNYTNYKNWAQANGKSLDSATAQTEFFMKQLPSSWSTGLHTSGYYAAQIPQYAKTAVSYFSWLRSSDLGFTTYAFLACYERPANWVASSSYAKRYQEAQKFYEQLTSSGGEIEASTQVQQSIVSAAQRTPSPGLNLCAMWVSSVYQHAGLGYIGGNANNMYRNFANNHDRSQLKVGMVVAVESSSSGGVMGAIYGHVGVYIGNGQVMHNVGSVQTMSLDKWIAFYGKTSPVGWGFPKNVSINK